MKCNRVIWTQNLNLYAPWLHTKIAKGRGIGVGKDYVPWIKTRDFSSNGTSGQIHSMRTERVIHTLSEYETIYFYILERDSSVIDIREQFPILNLPETIEIAFNLGYKHPSKSGKPQPITIDFLITLETPHGIKYVARSIKTPGDTEDPKVRLRLKIEEIWCDKYQIDWANIDTSSFNKEMLATLRSIRSWYRNGLKIDDDFADMFAKEFLEIYVNSGYSINEQCPIAFLPHATCTQVNRITGGCSCPGGTSATVVTIYPASTCNNGINVGTIRGYVYTCQ